MGLVYLSIIVILLLKTNGVNYLSDESHGMNKKHICILIGIILFLISAFKAISFNNGTGDLLNYYDRYLQLPYLSYNSLWNLYISNQLKDLGFYLFAKPFADMGFNAYIWMSVISLLFAYSISSFIYKYSTRPKLSFIILIALFFSFTLTGLRQTLALAFIINSYKYLLERNSFKYFIVILIASSFHSSALIVFPVYFFAKIKIGWCNILIVCGLFVSLFAPSIFRMFVNLLSWNDSLNSYATSAVSLSWSGYIIQLMIYFFSLFIRKYSSNLNKDKMKIIDTFIVYMSIGIFFQGFSNIVAEAFRISLYFSITSIIVVPNVISLNSNMENRKIITIVVVLLLIAYMFWSRAYFDLIFYWQM